MAAEPAGAHELQASAPAPLSLQQQRDLARLVDEHYGADGDGTALAVAVARFAFEQGLLATPAGEQDQREGMYLLPVTPWGDVKPLWFVTAAQSRTPAPRQRRRPTVRELGAEPISGRRDD